MQDFSQPFFADQGHAPSAAGQRLACDYAVAIGRFQPVHCGHVALLQACLRQARRVVVLAGSAHQPRSCKNPFTLQERAEMLRAALPAHERVRLQVRGVGDVPGDDAAWVAAIEAQVHAAIVADGANPAAMRVVLVGHLKDASSYYLRLFPRWQWLHIDNVAGINATDIRASYYAAAQPPDALWQQPAVVPASTVAFLQAFRRTQPGQALCAACAQAGACGN